jgi:hypothetical protein
MQQMQQQSLGQRERVVGEERRVAVEKKPRRGDPSGKEIAHFQNIDLREGDSV